MSELPLFWRALEKRGDSTVLIEASSGNIVSYHALCARAEAWTERLQGLAEGKAVVVVLEMEASVDGIAAYLGVLRSGFPVVIGEPGSFGADSAILRTYQPEIVVRRDGAALVAHRTAGDAERAAPHRDLRVLLSTSGSTGDPKLVRLSDTNIASNAEAIASYLGITADDRAMLTLPLHYSYGMSVLHSHLARGASLVLTDHSVADAAFQAEVSRYAATSMALVPYQIEMLAALPPERLPTMGMRYVTQAGGKLNPALVRQFKQHGDDQGWALVIMYGQTEASPRISYVPPELLPDAADSIGRAIPGGRLWLRDEAGHAIAEAGRAGELVYEGPNVMMGYATSRADLGRPAEVPALFTGDIAERDEAGLYRIVGRLSRFVKLFGLRLSLDQIEARMHQHGVRGYAVAVDDALVLLCRDAAQVERAKTAVADAYDLPLSAIHADVLHDVPLLTNGKVDMPRLRHIGRQTLDAARRVDVAAGPTIAEGLAIATRSKTVLPSDSFNTLGGDSLSYLHLQMILETRIGYVPDGWEAMPLATLQDLEDRADHARGTRSVLPVDVPLRLFAISLVVAEHATNLPLYGGPWVLLALMGYSAARFQLRLIADGKPLQLGIKMLFPILPLYLVILAIYGTSRGSVPLSNVVLLGNYHIWSKGTLIEPYWFVSLFCQIVGLLMLTATIPRLGKAVQSHSWAFAAFATIISGVAIMLSLGSIDGHISALPVPHVATWGLVETLPIFTCGWMLNATNGKMQAIASAGIAIALLMILACLPVTMIQVTLLAATFVLLTVPLSIYVPRSINRVAQHLASVTLFVYLFHEFVVFALMKLRQPQGVRAVAAIVIAFVVAIVVKGAFDLASDLITRRRAAGIRLLPFDLAKARGTGDPLRERS